MKTHKIAIAAVSVLAMAITAHASPIFGTWKGELSGRPITVTVTYTNGHAEVALVSEGHNLNATHAAFPKGGPPTLLRFQAAHQEGKTKLVSTASSDLSFELETSDGQQSLLRVIDQGKTIATVKMTKTEGVK